MRTRFLILLSALFLWGCPDNSESGPVEYHVSLTEPAAETPSLETAMLFKREASLSSTLGTMSRSSVDRFE